MFAKANDSYGLGDIHLYDEQVSYNYNVFVKVNAILMCFACTCKCFCYCSDIVLSTIEKGVELELTILSQSEKNFFFLD